MNDFTDEELYLLLSAVSFSITDPNTNRKQKSDLQEKIIDEISRREELSDLSFDDCESCKL